MTKTAHHSASESRGTQGRESTVQFAAKVANRCTALEAAQDEVNPEDLWKGTKTILLEVARETIASSRKGKRNGYLMRLSQQLGKRGKQKAKIRTNIRTEGYGTEKAQS